MRINHNIAAMNTYRQLGQANQAQQNSMEKLSSGLRINNASDDAAGLAISEKMRGQIRGLEQAQTNAQDGISMIQTAEGALNETHSILQRMRELSVQASNDTNTADDRGEIQKEINQLTSEINRIGNTTEFNTQNLLNGEKDSTITGTKSSVEFDLTGMSGGSVSALGISEAWDTDIGTTAGNLKSSIEADADLSAKYSVTVDANKITIETKTNTADDSMSADLSSATSVSDATVTSTEGQADGAAVQFQIGANENQSLSLEISDMRANALGLTGSSADFTTDTAVTNGTDATPVESALDVSTHENAANAVTVIQQAIDDVSAERSKLGATQNRLDHTINNLGTSAENLTAAESRIRDVDYALAAA